MDKQAERIAELEKENNHLRAILATGDGPCIYCNLPKLDWFKCSRGFPGCARADDAMLADDIMNQQPT